MVECGFFDRLRFGLTVKHIHGELQINRTGAPAGGGPIGQIDKFRDPFSLVADEGLFDHGFDNRGLTHVLQIQFFNTFNPHTA